MIQLITTSCCRERLGDGDVALKWFESYLKGRKQSVVINETLSSPVDVLHGVPQGSVLGTKLFTTYTLPIADIARKYKLEIHLYADDTQIYISFRTITTPHITIGNDDVPLNTSARNLGIMFDQHMNFEEHINNIRLLCFQHLKRISDISYLQKIQNSAARLITRTRKFDSITPVLRNP